MTITKLNHSCFLVEEGGVRILIDPGSYSVAECEGLRDIHIILITQIHQDHFGVELLRTLLKNNPGVKIITVQQVGAALVAENIDFAILGDGQSTTEKNVLIEGFGSEHAPIYDGIPVAQNTGYMIASRFFHPGDAFIVPMEPSLTRPRPVEILAIPTGGPWCKLSDSVDYARKVMPKICIPTHDGMYKPTNMPNHWLATLLAPLGISFVVLKDNEPTNF